MNKTFTPKPGRLMDQVREPLRFHHYACSTEKNYIQWILRYIRFNDRRHQALNAILFLYKEVL